jgi:hypothetical protein
VLLHDGWIFHMLPGESYCEKNGLRLEPFNVVRQIADGEMTPQQWEALCAERGIGALLLTSESTARV